MKLADKLRGVVSRMAWRAFSVPTYVKILGIGFGITFLFGAVAFHQIRFGIFRTHYKVHGETALSVALALASRLTPLAAANDISAMDEELSRTMAAFPDVRYIVVQDRDERILSHGFTFPKEAPPDLLRHGADLCASCHPSLSPKEIPTDLLEIPPKTALPTGRLRAYSRREGLVLEVTVPISGDDLGSVRLGVGDKVIAREMASISRSLLWSLALCLLVGLSLALMLAYLLVRPIHNLVQATDRIREGDFEARADVFSEDEIGMLAVAFNQMADGLQTYRQEVQEKEAARVSLIRKIVQAQEDERKSVARELHDQLGQSLSNTLLMIESRCDGCPDHDRDRCERVKSGIRGLIDEVRRLAWDVRPSIRDDYGLDHALARYVEEMSKRVDFPIDYQCAVKPGSERLPNQIEVTLYRIAQEAMTNIIRHAEATQASVVLLYYDREVSLIVEDNGRGFDVASVEKDGGPPLGLIGMKERAALVGGHFVLASELGKGTTLRVRIPLDEVDHADPNSDSG